MGGPNSRREKIVLQGLDTYPPVRVSLRIVLGDSESNHTHISLSLGDGYARFKAPHHKQPVVPVIYLVGPEHQRHDHLKLDSIQRTGRRHSHHGVRHTIHSQWLADDSAVRAQTLPKLVSQNDDVVLAGRTF